MSGSIFKTSVVMIGFLLWSAFAANAQQTGCALIPDDRNPPEMILRCGDELTVHSAHGTRSRPASSETKTLPSTLRLDEGALLIELRPSQAPRNFQILTPQASAAVRGTRWAVQARVGLTSIFVFSGKVAVAPVHGGQTIVLQPGQGVDVSDGAKFIEGKPWPEDRIRAILALFGE